MMMPFLETLPSSIPDVTALGVAGFAIWGLVKVVTLTKEERDRDREERREDRNIRRAEVSAHHAMADVQRDALNVLGDALSRINEHSRQEEVA